MLRLKQILPLLIIFLIGAFVRFNRLSDFPVSLNWDEVSHGYNAFSVWKTGKDEWGNFLPLIFRAFGDYKLPIYIYSSIIPIAIFGLNVFSVRFISALAGSLAILGIYLLTHSLTSNRRIALISAFLLCFLPWHFFISRPALEANLSLTLIIFGFYFLVNSLKHPKSLLLASVLLGLSLHTYNTARVFVPLLVLSFLILNYQSWNRSLSWRSITFLSSLLIFLASLGLVASQVFTGQGTARYDKLKILSESVVYQIGEQRQKSSLPDPLPRILYNRPLYFSSVFLKNYLSYFSLNFFNQTKGAQTQFAIAGENLLGFPILVAAILGLLYLLKSKQFSYRTFLISWLLLSPLAAALTADPPQALRPNPMIPVLVILAAIALANLKNIKLIYLAFILVLINFFVYSKIYYTSYATAFAPSWQYGYKELFTYLKSLPEQNQNIFITKKYGEPHIFYAFYNKIDPKTLFASDQAIRFYQSGWYWTDKINNYYFVNDWDIPRIIESTIKLESKKEIPTKNSLLVTAGAEVPQGTDKIHQINFPDGKTAFIISRVP